MKNPAKSFMQFVVRSKNLIAVALGFLMISAHSAFASTSGAMPWDTPLQTVKNDLTGPAALAISTCALFACGATLVFGGEMNEFVKRGLYAVLAISFIVGGASFMSSVFGVGGATVGMIYVQPALTHIASFLHLGAAV